VQREGAEAEQVEPIATADSSDELTLLGNLIKQVELQSRSLRSTPPVRSEQQLDLIQQIYEQVSNFECEYKKLLKDMEEAVYSGDNETLQNLLKEALS
jgi:archaellum component FlaC